MKNILKTLILSTILLSSHAFAKKTYELEMPIFPNSRTDQNVIYSTTEKAYDSGNLVFSKKGNSKFETEYTVNYYSQPDGSFIKSEFVTFNIKYRDNIKIGQYNTIQFLSEKDNFSKNVVVRGGVDSYTFHDSFSFKLTEKVKNLKSEVNNYVIIKSTNHKNEHKVYTNSIETFVDNDLGMFKEHRPYVYVDGVKKEHYGRGGRDFTVKENKIDNRIEVEVTDTNLKIIKKPEYDSLIVKLIVVNQFGHEEEMAIMLNEEKTFANIEVSQLNL